MPWSRTAFEADLSFSHAINLVAIEEGSVVGYVVGWVDARDLHIGNLAVIRTARRQGIATLLLKNLLHASLSRGARVANLEVRPSNKPALSLYRRLGFRSVARRPRYYVPDREDAIIMELTLREGPETACGMKQCAFPTGERSGSIP
jgi:ribosomal-protein-alanine N-acetyltransferase